MKNLLAPLNGAPAGGPGGTGGTGGQTTNIRLRTLVGIRWVAVSCQAATILTVHFGLGHPVPLGPALAVVGVSVIFNLFFAFRPAGERLLVRDAAAQLAWDIVQLSALLGLTGGLANPFAILLLAPVLVSAAVLPRAATVALGLFASVCLTILAFLHLPVPLGETFDPPVLYIVGIWQAAVIAMLFTGIYVGRVAAEARGSAAALAATQMALAREQQLSALGALAAAAAHELGSPLGTIAVIAREMQRELEERGDPSDPALVADVELLLEQTGRCREILAGLARLPEAKGGAPWSRIPLTTLVEAAAERHRDEAVTLEFRRAPGDGSDEPVVERTPEALHGLGNLVQNAVQHAAARVVVETAWNSDSMTVTIDDDGPGIPEDIRNRIGEPWIHRKSGRRGGSGQHMGLGTFIARTLLERTGARLRFANRSGGGASVAVLWSRTRPRPDQPMGTETE